MARPSKYTPEFRREALELIGSSGRTIAEVARSLGINDGTLGNWVKADREARERSADPAALTESERDELRRLRKEVAELQLEREICVKRPRISRGRRSGEPLPFRRGSPGGLPGLQVVCACRRVPVGLLRLAVPAALESAARQRAVARGDPRDP